MRLFIRCKNLKLSGPVQERIRSRLASILARFADRIGDVTTTLADLNGPKGGEDKQCRLVVRLPHGGKVTIEETDRNLFAAISRASDRIKRTVSRAVQRRHDAKTKRGGFKLQHSEPLSRAVAPGEPDARQCPQPCVRRVP